MKRNQDINYKELKNDLDNIDKTYSSLNLSMDLNDYYNSTCYTGKSDSKFFMISTDVQRLTKQLIFYFYATIKNFNFVDLYDKEFVEAFKMLVKDEDEFKSFLDMTGFTIDDYIHLGVYICPNAFTSTLIKFIQTKYLNIFVQKKRKSKRITKSKTK